MTTDANVATVLTTRLTEARQVLGFTQTDVAGAVGLNRSAISEIETGNRNVTALELRRLAKLYRRPLSWFYGRPDPTIPDDLAAAVAGLSEPDRNAVLEFARFLAHQEVTR